MDKEQIIFEVLMKCQQYGKTYIVGGYIRNKLLGYEFKDVDMLTTCSIQRLKQIFPQLNWTEQGFELGVARMHYRGIEFEFSSCLEEEFEEKLVKRDFTINAFYFDGNTLMAQSTGSEDIEKKLLRQMANFQDKLDFSPHTILRAFRFVSLYNLKWSDDLLLELKNSTHFFKEIPNGRLQSEAYDMLKGESILRTLYYYEQLNLILPNPKLEELKDVSIPLYNQNTGARLVYLSYLIGKQSIIEWINLHKISNKLVEEIQEYLPYLKTDQLIVPPKKLPYLTLLKRYQYNDDKEKIKDFLKNNHKKT